MAHVQERSHANGPGCRAVVWFRGCEFRCPGCANQDLWPREPCSWVSPGELFSRLAGIEEIEGVTLTGGEPLLQGDGLVELLELLGGVDLSVVCFTGFEWEEIPTKLRDVLEKRVDVLVAGRFVRELSQDPGPLRGSSNQRVIFLSSRYSPEDLEGGPQVEVVLSGDGSHVTGFPPPDLVREITDCLLEGENCPSKERIEGGKG
ncbi:MAG: 4Fe-4S single cluster domain-containing protein [Promethearchaeota archaeon]